MPGNCDGTQPAMSTTLLADAKFVQSVHELIDTMIAGG